jgi:hypothetical protein
MAKTSTERFSYGLTILIIGIMLLLGKVGILSNIPYGYKLISIGTFFLIGGIVFLINQPKSAEGWIFLVTGILLNTDIFFGWSNYSSLVDTIALILVGLIMILIGRK